MPAYTIKITGKVTGVFYRDFTKKNAEILELTGWVKNDKKAVIAYIQGEEDRIDEFLTFLWSGPESSKVKDIQKEPSTEDSEITIFEIRY